MATVVFEFYTGIHSYRLTTGHMIPYVIQWKFRRDPDSFYRMKKTYQTQKGAYNQFQKLFIEETNLPWSEYANYVANPPEMF